MSITIPEYFTEDAKMVKTKRHAWTFSECEKIHTTLYSKGYFMNCVSRIGSDMNSHDAWQVEREDIPTLIEMLFRARIPVEVQAEGHGKASIIFVYNTPAYLLLDCVPRFHKNPNNGGIL